MTLDQRREIKNKIKNAISKKAYFQNFIDKIELFSTRELSLILPFFENGDLSGIDIFIKEKKQEYLQILEEIKIKKRFEKLNSLKMEEKIKTKEEIEDSEKKLELFFS